MNGRSPSGRRGRAVNLTLDNEADALLREMTSGPRTLGRFVSSLLRAEKIRRDERARLLDAVQTVIDNPVLVAEVARAIGD